MIGVGQEVGYCGLGIGTDLVDCEEEGVSGGVGGERTGVAVID